MKTVLAVVDLSDRSMGIACCALDLASGPDDRVYLVHVTQPNPDFIGYEVGPETVREAMAHALHEEHRALGALKDALDEHDARKVTALLIQGVTVDKIIEEQRRLQAEWLVIGSHGHGALYHLLTGSVTEGVLRKATCPVVVVPPPNR